MGYKLLKLDQESKRKRKADEFEEYDQNEDEESINSCGESNSFEDSNNPYADRVVGVTKAGQNRRETISNNMNKKKCQQCFINGKMHIL